MNDLLIDTNSLILYILGTVNPEYFADNRKHDRISAFSKKEFDFLCSIIASHQRLVSSPNVWTEVDNLCTNYIHGDDKYRYIQIMNSLISNSFEKYLETATVLTDYECFYRIGVTDSILLKLAQECKTLVTADSKLSDSAHALGINVVDLKAIATNNIFN